MPCPRSTTCALLPVIRDYGDSGSHMQAKDLFDNHWGDSYRDLEIVSSHPPVHQSRHPALDSMEADIYKGTVGQQQVYCKQWREIRSRLGNGGLVKFARALMDWKRGFSHPNVLAFIGIWEAPGVPFPRLILPRVEGNINDFLQQTPEANKLTLIYQVALALQHLHDQQPVIVHGNVRGSNVLVTREGHVYLTDIAVHNALFDPGTFGPNSRWYSPELLLAEGVTDEPRCTAACDVWSFGMTVLEIYSGEDPYQDLGNIPLAFALSRQQIPHRPPNMASESYNGIWEILERCWRFNPSMRPPMSAIVPWLRSLGEQESLAR